MYAASSALALVVLLATFESGLCINCYQCASVNSEGCKDPFNNGKNVATLNCESPEVANFYRTSLSYLNIPPPQTANVPRYCVKMIFESNSGDMVMRTCMEGASNNMNKTCVELENLTNGVGKVLTTVGSGLKTSLKHCSVCDTDRCNGAAGTAASVVLAAGAAALAFLGYH